MISVYLQGVLDSTEDEEIIIGAFKDEELNVATASWLDANGRSGEYSYIWQTENFEDKVYLQQVRNRFVTGKMLPQLFAIPIKQNRLWHG